MHGSWDRKAPAKPCRRPDRKRPASPNHIRTNAAEQHAKQQAETPTEQSRGHGDAQTMPNRMQDIGIQRWMQRP